jgi:hypothetical protein
MKAIFMLLFSLLMVSCHSQDEIKSKYVFSSYKLNVGYSNYQPLIELYKDNLQVFRNCGGDGKYEFVDTLKINDDNYPDFLLMLHSDDYFTVYALISEGKSKYTQVRYKDFSYGDIYCNIDSKQLKYIYLQDVDNDGRKEVLINVIEEEQTGRLKNTNCSDTLKL